MKRRSDSRTRMIRAHSIHHFSPNWGELATKTYAFVKGKEYPFRVKWVDTINTPDPDYDYTAKIGGLSGSGAGPGYRVDDSRGILGIHWESDYDFAAGKSGMLYIQDLKVDVDGTDALSGDEVSEKDEDIKGVLVLGGSDTPVANLIVRSCGETGWTRKLRFSDYNMLKINGAALTGPDYLVSSDSDYEEVLTVTQNGIWLLSDTVIATLTVEKDSKQYTDAIKLVASEVKIDINNTEVEEDDIVGVDDTVSAQVHLIAASGASGKVAFSIVPSSRAGVSPQTATMTAGTPLALTITGKEGSEGENDTFIVAKINGDERAKEDFSTINVDIVDDATTDYNFSPSLGEDASIKVDIDPAPPSGGFPGLSFKLEVVRELKGGGEQHIDWVDVKPSSSVYGSYRAADFDVLSFTWDGIPDVFGSAAALAEGPAEFTGASASFNRKLPAVTINRCAPPPVYTLVAKIMRDSDGSVLCEDRHVLYVPQVIKLLFDSSAVTILRSPLEYVQDGTTLYGAISDAQWTTMKGTIESNIQAFYTAAGANVRVVGASVSVAQPYNTVQMVEGNETILGWTTEADFGNPTPAQTANISVKGWRWAIWRRYDTYGSLFAVPVTVNELSFGLSKTGSHETGHTLGLVSPGGVLNGTAVGTSGDSSGWHNQPPYNNRRVMNPGAAHPPDDNLGRSGSWSWISRNGSYLEFILPK